jgi:hypothetical protein
MTFPQPIYPGYSSGGGAFNPASISGLVAWLDISNAGSLTLVGSDIHSATDLSGTGNTFTGTGSAGGYPHLQTAAQNGLNTASIVTGAYYSKFTTPSIATASGYSIIGVFARSTSSSYIGVNAGSPSALLYWKANGGITTSLFTGTTQYYTSGSNLKNNTAYHVLALSYTLGGSSKLYYDSSDVTETVNSAGSGTSGAVSFVGYGDGSVGELLIYNNSIGSANLLAVQAYLSAKWGTP